jgi:hypothetical protein
MAQNLGHFCKFRKTIQSKQSPNSQNFAQSGHPAATRLSTVRASLGKVRAPIFEQLSKTFFEKMFI